MNRNMIIETAYEIISGSLEWGSGCEGLEEQLI